MYSWGDMIAPCGTPLGILCLLETVSHNVTWKVLLIRNEWIILIKCSGILNLMSLYIKALCQTQSKAFFTSSVIRDVTLLILKLFEMISVMRTSWWTVLAFVLKPNCSGIKQLFSSSNDFIRCRIIFSSILLNCGSRLIGL